MVRKKERKRNTNIYEPNIYSIDVDGRIINIVPMPTIDNKSTR